MRIKVQAPACMPLALVPSQTAAGLCPALLGITVKYPPVHLSARRSTGLKVEGARADRGYLYAERFLNFHRLPHEAAVEIELAVPSLVGLGSDAILALSVARALALLYELPAEDTPALARAAGLGSEDALEAWAFDRGGLLLVEAARNFGSRISDFGFQSEIRNPKSKIPLPLRRFEIAHAEKDAWAFVLLLPRIPPGTPETLESDRRELMLEDAQNLAADAGEVVEHKLWPALEQDDFEGFADALMDLIGPGDSRVTGEAGWGVSLMRDCGAAAWGRLPTGLGFFGLVKGASASQELRKALREKVGAHGGIVMATITDNQGAQHAIREGE